MKDVRVTPLLLLFAVHLDAELRGGGIEVEHVGTDAVLATKSDAESVLA